MISAINISQTNELDGCKLLSIHNPIVFLADVTYSGDIPQALPVDLIDEDDNTLGTFACIPFKDVSPTVRQFAFVADSIIRGTMLEPDDFTSVKKTLEYVPNITKKFTIRFYDGEIESTCDFVACHGARQYGESPSLNGIENNTDEITYYAAEGKPVYIYFYNNDATNVITVGTGELVYERLLDFDDVALLDFDNLFLTTL
jgi:hypothetical protein